MMNKVITDRVEDVDVADTALAFLLKSSESAAEAKQAKDEAYQKYLEAIAGDDYGTADVYLGTVKHWEEVIQNSMKMSADFVSDMADIKEAINNPYLNDKPWEERFAAFKADVLGETDQDIPDEVKEMARQQNEEFIKMVRETFGDEIVDLSLKAEQEAKASNDGVINPEAKENATDKLYSWSYSKLYPHGGYRGVLKYELSHKSCDPMYYLYLLGIQDQLRHNTYEGSLEINAIDYNGDCMGYCMKHRDIPVEEMGDFANMIDELVNSYTLYTYSRMLHGHLTDVLRLTNPELEQIWVWLKHYNDIFVDHNDDSGAAIEYLKGIEDTRILDYSKDVIELIVEDYELIKAN